MIAHDPVHVPVEHRLPEIFNVGTGADGRVHLGVGAGGRVVVEEQVAHGDFAAEGNVREGARHHEGRLQRLARGQVQEIDVHAARLVR